MKEAGIVVDYVLEFRSAAHFFFNGRFLLMFSKRVQHASAKQR